MAFKLFQKLFPGRRGRRGQLPYPRPRGGGGGVDPAAAAAAFQAFQPGGGGGPISLVEDDESGEMMGVDARGQVYPVVQTRGDLLGDDMGDDLGDEFGDDLGDEFGDDLGDDMGDDLGDDMGDDLGDDDDFLDGDDDMDFDDDLLGDDLFGDDMGDDLFGDDMGDDVMGAVAPAAQRRIQVLTRKIQRLQSLPTPRGMFWRKRAAARVKKIRRLAALRRKLMGRVRGKAGQRRGATAAILAAAGLGVGGGALGAALGRQRLVNRLGPTEALLDPQRAQAVRRGMAQAGARWDVNAPPPSGQLNALPMFPFDDLQNPRNAITVPLAGIATAVALRTRDLPFAIVLITGFTSSTKGTASGTGAIGMVRNFTIEGGTNLFLSNGWQPADNYDVAFELAGGLRNKPIVRSPNFASVEITASGDTDDVVILVCNTVVDALQDDVYGTGLAGPTSG